MRLGVESTIDEVLKDVGATARKVPNAMNAGVNRVVGHTYQVSLRRVARIYQRPVPTRAQVNAYNRKGGGKRPRKVGGQGAPAWKRTGQLEAGVRKTEAVNGKAEIAVPGLPQGRVRGRHNLRKNPTGPKDWRPKRPALGIIRENPWMEETVEITEPQWPALYEDGIRKELKL